MLRHCFLFIGLIALCITSCSRTPEYTASASLGLLDGLRHCQDAELCPRRHHYDRRLCFLLLHVLFKSPPHRGHPAGSDRLHRPRHRDRAAGLCASALRPLSLGRIALWIACSQCLFCLRYQPADSPDGMGQKIGISKELIQ